MEGEADLKSRVLAYKRGMFVEGLKSKPGSDKYEETRVKLQGLQGIVEKQEPDFFKNKNDYM